jgi:hypothetical protein
MCWRLPLAVCIAALTVPALAQESASAVGQEAMTAPDPGASTPDQEEDITVTGMKPTKKKRVCRRSVATGSIMAQTTCRTVAEWDEGSAKAVAQAERLKEEQRQRVFLQDAVCQLKGRC